MWRTGRVVSDRRAAIPAVPGGRPLDPDRELFVEWYGAGVALSHRDDQPFLLWHLLNATAIPGADVYVVCTRAAAGHPDAGRVLTEIAGQASLMRRGSEGHLQVGLLDVDGPPADERSLTYWLAELPVRTTVMPRRHVPPAPAVLSRGWRRETDRSYRHDRPHVAVAEVLPAGILLRPEQVYADGAVAVFEPPEWTVVIGSPVRPVPAALVAMLRQVWLDAPADPRPPRVEVAGYADPSTLERVAALTEELRERRRGDAADVPSHTATQPPVEHPPERGPTRPRLVVPGSPEPDSHVGWPLAEDPPALAMTWPPPERSAASITWPPQERPASSMTRPHPERTAALPEPAASPAATMQPGDWHPTPPGRRPAPPPVVTMVDPEATVAEADRPPGWRSSSPAYDTAEQFLEAGRAALAEPNVRRASRWLPAPVRAVADRMSTEEEQRRFAAALGSRFTDLLSVVNAAMARWPMLRRDAADAAKADFVAVCLYLGASTHGAVALNAALRGGQLEMVDGYLACLVSGLRQLPLHRRPVLCQARLDQSAQTLYPIGSLVTEPALLSVDVMGAITTPDADVDFLIWPRTARQAAVLGSGGDVDEAVFPPGSRLRVLTVDDELRQQPAAGLAAPPTAVLLRELLPDEQPAGTELDDADRTALGKLRHALAQRRATGLRALADRDAVARIGWTPPGYTAANAVGGPVSAS